jgi:hypothetical protein
MVYILIFDVMFFDFSHTKIPVNGMSSLMRVKKGKERTGPGMVPAGFFPCCPGSNPTC